MYVQFTFYVQNEIRTFPPFLDGSATILNKGMIEKKTSNVEGELKSQF